MQAKQAMEFNVFFCCETDQEEKYYSYEFVYLNFSYNVHFNGFIHSYICGGKKTRCCFHFHIISLRKCCIHRVPISSQYHIQIHTEQLIEIVNVIRIRNGDNDQWRTYIWTRIVSFCSMLFVCRCVSKKNTKNVFLMPSNKWFGVFWLRRAQF